MRKIIFAFFLTCICFGGHVTLAHASDCSKETLMQKWGDWIRTISKKGDEKERVLAKRKADRALACAKRKGEKATGSLWDSLDCSEKNLRDQWPDWLVTLGKSEAEKDQILAAWKADPVLACAKLKAEKAAEDARTSSEKLQEQLEL